MGIDWVCGDYAQKISSYSGFNSIRTEIAKYEGIILDDMVGFGGEVSWESTPTTLRPFLDHSDCDGELTPQECKQMVPRMREIVKLARDEGMEGTAEAAELCLAFMEVSVLHDEDIIFC